ncbi:hypothetical protein NW739_06480 [Mycoplasmopsis felis]|uniref:hypothetical protein n=1 Tax=Mycoplasmopsis felis TaxID=33923 RepID=UPI0021DF98CE|nr:hypothetical protein [Mycoplasmopsis felis]MCU9940290.1 hypothetical protein [Mycoplasmopsis felis]
MFSEPPKTIPPVSTPEPTPKPKPSGSETLVQIAGVYVKAKVNKKIPLELFLIMIKKTD